MSGNYQQPGQPQPQDLTASQGYLSPTDAMSSGGKGGPYPMSLAHHHQTIESNLSSLLAMTGILVVLAILLLFTMMHATRKNFKKYCEPLRKTQYGTRKWVDGRWVYN